MPSVSFYELERKTTTRQNDERVGERKKEREREFGVLAFIIACIRLEFVRAGPRHSSFKTLDF